MLNGLPEIEPLCLQLSLVKSTVMLGEPIVLQYKLTSHTEQEIQTYMGKGKRDWLAMDIASASGSSMPPRLDPRLPRGGISSYGMSVSPRSQATGYCVVTRQFLLSHPGEYRLTIDVRLPYVMGSEAAGVNPSPWEQKFGTVLAESHEFPLVATEAEPAYLRTVAETLWRSMVQVSGSERRMLIASLFSMPVEYSIESWRAAASDQKLLDDRFYIADQLESANSIAAADVLSEMVQNTPPDRLITPAVLDAEGKIEQPAFEFSFSVHRQFCNMYFHADAPLKAHLVKWYSDRGFTVPDKPIMIID